MKINLSQIYSRVFWAKLNRDIFEIAGSSPRNYWEWFLAVFSLLFLSALIVNVYLFLSLWSGRSPVPVEVFGESGPRVNLSGLNSAVKIIRDKEAEFQKVITLPAARDPSL